MVKLGQRTDTKPKRSEVDAWINQFVFLYGNLLADCRMVLHHEKRIRTIDGRMNDSAYLNEHSVSPDAIVEAQNTVSRHRAMVEIREARIDNAVAMFPGFWRGRPDGVDAWLTDMWFSCAPDPDPVVVCMVGRGAECWQEVEQRWRDRKPIVNNDPIPY